MVWRSAGGDPGAETEHDVPLPGGFAALRDASWAPRERLRFPFAPLPFATACKSLGLSQTPLVATLRG